LIATFLVDVFVVVGHIIGHPGIQTLDFLDFICGIFGNSGIIARNGNMKCTAVSHFGSRNLNNLRSQLKRASWMLSSHTCQDVYWG